MIIYDFILGYSGFTVVTSRLGNPMIRVENYTFSRKRTNGKKTTWVCSSHTYKGCQAKVMLYGQEIVSLNNCHNH